MTDCDRRPGRARSERTLLILGTTLFGLLAGLLLAGFLLGGDRSAVAWKPLRAVVFESDDWGLPGFVPEAGAWQGIDRQRLAPGHFPPVYWGSTLEDSAAVAALVDVLARQSPRSAENLPPVLQPNYILGSWAWVPEGQGRTWRHFRWPEFSPAYARPGLAQAVAAGVVATVWYPEFHGAQHYDPQLRRAATARDSLAAVAAGRDILLFPGSASAWELGPWRSDAELEEELEASLRNFRVSFGRPPGSAIAPDYTWDARSEDRWHSRGLTVIQAKREQRYPGRRWTLWARIGKVLRQRWERQLHRDRVYLERNCRFEPAQAPDHAAVVRTCWREVQQAWGRGQPAIVETHRINFVHTDPQVPVAGRAALLDLLTLMTEDPRERASFLVDTEVAQLMRQGVSICRRGEVTIIRNGTRGTRILPAAPDLLPDWLVTLKPAGQTMIIKIPGRSTLLLIPDFKGYGLVHRSSGPLEGVKLHRWGEFLPDDESSPEFYRLLVKSIKNKSL